MRKIISLILAIALVIVACPAVFAEETVQKVENFTQYDVMAWEFATLNPSNINSKVTNKISITIPYVGCSTFLDLSNFGENIDKELIKIENSNDDVVSVLFKDQISAIGIGKSILKFSYGNLQQLVEVNVEKEFTEAEIEKMKNESILKTRAVTRTNMVNKASTMVSYSWKPTKELIKWGTSASYFPANVYQQGIPYTQSLTQCDEVTFQAKMSESDFYSPSGITLSGVYYYQPKYGSDCSGFVSHCWGISRINTSTFYSRAQSGVYSILPNFSRLEPGDAVVKAADHIMLIGANYQTPPSGSEFTSPYVFVYEQTPPKARYAFYTYVQLSSRPYTPISFF